MTSYTKEGARAGMGVATFLAIVLVVIGALGFGGHMLKLWTLPWLLEIERQAVVNSVQFVEARKTAGFMYYAAWLGGDCGGKSGNAQCAALAANIATEMRQIDLAKVPGDLRRFLN